MHTDILLRTAFACMACDGEISPDEVKTIRSMATDDSLFGDIDIDASLAMLTDEINRQGKAFLQYYLQQLGASELSREEELEVCRIAVRTIQADAEVRYSEVKFFKVLRQCLHVVTDDEILAACPTIDDFYLAQDVRADFVTMLNDYFSAVELPQFDLNAVKSEEQ